MRMYPLIRPLLFALPAERAHALALSSLQYAHSLGLVRRPADDPAAAVTLMGLRFPNRVGLAAGFDKNGRYVDALGALGFGFIEVGTVTPRAQGGQPRPRLLRIAAADALINRMGFPNEGAAAVAAHLSRRTFAGVCGVNIGKNATTQIEAAVGDYVECFRALAPRADYVAINVSSPNTQGLRRLQEIDQLQPIVDALIEAREQLLIATRRRVPLLIKLSPDLAHRDLVGIANLVRRAGLDGIIATNTTVSRVGIAHRWQAEGGGLSGAPLRPLALQAVRLLRAALGAGVPIIAAGGIASARHAADAIQAGADLVQVYTGLIYEGPGLIREVTGELALVTGRKVEGD
jgi:dihydroorotate dehydrogenase